MRQSQKNVRGFLQRGEPHYLIKWEFRLPLQVCLQVAADARVCGENKSRATSYPQAQIWNAEIKGTVNVNCSFEINQSNGWKTYFKDPNESFKESLYRRQPEKRALKCFYTSKRPYNNILTIQQNISQSIFQTHEPPLKGWGTFARRLDSNVAEILVLRPFYSYPQQVFSVI